MFWSIASQASANDDADGDKFKVARSDSTFSAASTAATERSLSHESLSDVFPEEVITRLASFACMREAWALKSASSMMRAAAAPATIASTQCTLYVCGGARGAITLRSAECYNPLRGQWETIPDMAEKRRCATVAAIGSCLYVIGGSNGTQVLQSVECFDAETGSWKFMADMKSARAWASAGAIGGKVYVCGGTTTTTVPHSHLDAAEQFDPDTNEWTCMPRLHEARMCAASAVLLGHLYVCGGSHGAGAMRSFEVFDPQRATWSKRPPMPSARRWAACCAIGGTTLCVCGGEDGSGNMASASLFAVEDNSWTVLPDMQEGAWWSSAASSVDGIYVLGGTDGAQALSRMERFDVYKGEWEMLPPMLQRRNAAVSAALLGRDDVPYLRL